MCDALSNCQLTVAFDCPFESSVLSWRVTIANSESPGNALVDRFESTECTATPSVVSNAASNAEGVRRTRSMSVSAGVLFIDWVDGAVKRLTTGLKVVEGVGKAALRTNQRRVLGMSDNQRTPHRFPAVLHIHRRTIDYCRLH